MREAFEQESKDTGKPRLLITMAVPASLEYAGKGFDIATLDKHLDFFNLLTYDYHSAYEPATNHHSPLYRPGDWSDFDFRADLNIVSLATSTVLPTLSILWTNLKGLISSKLEFWPLEYLGCTFSNIWYWKIKVLELVTLHYYYILSVHYYSEERSSSCSKKSAKPFFVLGTINSLRMALAILRKCWRHHLCEQHGKFCS